MSRRLLTAAGLGRAGLIAGFLVGVAAAPVAAQGPAPGTPAEMVATYNTLADGLLALKRTEENLVKSILATAKAHGEVELARARKAMAAGDAAGVKTALEAVAADVAQIGTEGDNSVAAVRKRLIEAGQHHNAAGEAQGVYDEGYVIVTKAAKQKLLDASKTFAQQASAPKAADLDAAWASVQSVYTGLMKPAH